MRIFGKEVGTTTLVVGALVLVAALGGAWYWKKSNDDDKGDEGDQKAPTQPIPTGATKKGLTVAGVGTVYYN